VRDRTDRRGQPRPADRRLTRDRGYADPPDNEEEDGYGVAVKEGGQGGPLRRESIAAAVADTACKAKTNLVAVSRVELWDGLPAGGKEQLPQLTRFRAHNDAKAADAQKLMAKLGRPASGRGPWPCRWLCQWRCQWRCQFGAHRAAATGEVRPNGGFHAGRPRHYHRPVDNPVCRLFLWICGYLRMWTGGLFGWLVV
jgi:hypothetical protein